MTLLGIVCYQHIVEKRDPKRIEYLLEKGANPNKNFIWTFVELEEVLLSPLEFVSCMRSFDGREERQVRVADILVKHKARVMPLIIGLAKEEAENPALVALLKKAYEEKERVTLKDLASEKEPVKTEVVIDVATAEWKSDVDNENSRKDGLQKKVEQERALNSGSPGADKKKKSQDGARGNGLCVVL